LALDAYSMLERDRGYRGAWLQRLFDDRSFERICPPRPTLSA
jgi:hypothetical protein